MLQWSTERQPYKRTRQERRSISHALQRQTQRAQIASILKSNESTGKLYAQLSKLSGSFFRTDTHTHAQHAPFSRSVYRACSHLFINNSTKRTARKLKGNDEPLAILELPVVRLLSFQRCAYQPHKFFFEHFLLGFTINSEGNQQP
uniref:Uncharacterized protein n=1 Tax=Bactrocera dorsalis TaxID=27457 RepID=A0A034WHG5_BACDO